MKKVSIFLLFFINAGYYSQAQEEEINTNFGVGLQIAQYQQDFGIGLNATSPYFAYDKVAVRLRANLMWNEHLTDAGTSTWSNYSNLSVGIVGVGGQIGNSIRLYGEGGFILLFPSEAFSSNNTDFGGYGLFGFEFFMSPFTNYFIEIGGVGTGAREDKLPTQTIYSNGLLIDVGFRAQF